MLGSLGAGLTAECGTRRTNGSQCGTSIAVELRWRHRRSLRHSSKSATAAFFGVTPSFRSRSIIGIAVSIVRLMPSRSTAGTYSSYPIAVMKRSAASGYEAASSMTRCSGGTGTGTGPLFGDAIWTRRSGDSAREPVDEVITESIVVG